MLELCGDRDYSFEFEDAIKTNDITHGLPGTP